MRRRLARFGWAASALLLGGYAWGQGAAPATSPASGTTSALDAGAPGAAPEDAAGTCVERVPSGKARPTLRETFPSKAESGHAVALQVAVEHGKGETVLPGGFRGELETQGMRALEAAGFHLPHPDGGAGPTLQLKAEGDRATTEVTIRFVPLPEKPGRQQLVLPPLPITVARASGELVTVCTAPHPITVEDPIANTPDPEPVGNPPPRPQLEEWTALKNAVYVALIALPLGALAAFLISRWLRRPRPEPPPPPPRPPWEVALEELFDIRHAGLIRAQRLSEHFERVSDVMRKYLGARYGFDGLECTTREMVSRLRRVTPPVPALGSIESFLRQADLVKFARVAPTEQESEYALVSAEEIVRSTTPAPEVNPPVGPVASPGDGPPDPAEAAAESPEERAR